MKSVTYWYQFFTAREELVPILHDVKFTKCEIYGSTRLYHLNDRFHYENTHMQYTAIFHGCKNVHFQMNFFLFLLKTLIVGTR